MMIRTVPLDCWRSTVNGSMAVSRYGGYADSAHVLLGNASKVTRVGRARPRSARSRARRARPSGARRRPSAGLRAGRQRGRARAPRTARSRSASALEDGVLRVEVLDPGPGFTYVPRARRAGERVAAGGCGSPSASPTRWANDRAARACGSSSSGLAKLTIARYRDRSPMRPPPPTVLARPVHPAGARARDVARRPSRLPARASRARRSWPTATGACTSRRSTRSSATTTARSIARSC